MVTLSLHPSLVSPVHPHFPLISLVAGWMVAIETALFKRRAKKLSFFSLDFLLLPLSFSSHPTVPTSFPPLPSDVFASIRSKQTYSFYFLLAPAAYCGFTSRNPQTVFVKVISKYIKPFPLEDILTSCSGKKI